MKIKRLTLTGETTEVSFTTFCGDWLVKNFSDNDVYVSFDENLDEDEAVKIPSGYGQKVVDNKFLGGLDHFEHNAIYVKGTGEVEVQQLCFH